MNNIYLIANSFSRFYSELCAGRRGDSSSLCSRCGYPMDRDDKPVFFWDKYFCDASRSIDEGHDIYWAEFSMLATQHGADLLASTGLPLTFTPAKFFTQEELRSSELETLDIHMPLTLVEPTHYIDMINDTLKTCEVCGKIEDAVWKLNGLFVHRVDTELFDVFRFKQNRGSPTFVTEQGKSKLGKLQLRGLAFYKAGTVVD
jgi:hypothetical protein